LLRALQHRQGRRDVREFGKDQARLTRIPSKAKAPLRGAALLQK
jgi:hypothetical protein